MGEFADVALQVRFLHLLLVVHHSVEPGEGAMGDTAVPVWIINPPLLHAQVQSIHAPPDPEPFPSPTCTSATATGYSGLEGWWSTTGGGDLQGTPRDPEDTSHSLEGKEVVSLFQSLLFSRLHTAVS